MARFHLLILFLLVLWCPSLILAHSPVEGQIFASIGPLLSRTIVDRPFDGKDGARWGAGVLVQGDFNKRWGLEIGVMNIHRQYYVSTFGTEIVERVQRVHIPILVRYRLWSFLSLGFGPFASYTTGEVQRISFSNQSLLGDTRTSANDIAEHGLDLSATLDFPILEKYYIVVDGRYSWSLTSKQFEKADHWNLFIGFKIPITPGK